MLGQAATAAPGASELINVNGTPATMWDMVVGLIPGSIGETSVIAIALGAIILLWTGVASWKTMFSGLCRWYRDGTDFQCIRFY